MAEERKKAAAGLAALGIAAVGLGYLLTRKPPAPPVPPLPSISSNKISTDKTSLSVNEIAVVDGILTFESPLPRDAEAVIDVFSNDVKVQSFKSTYSKGSSTGVYRFNISFTSPGSYAVYTDARWS